MAESKTKSKKKPMMSDIGLEMDELMTRVKTMKGHKDAKDKLSEMQTVIENMGDESLIKKAYFLGVKVAEDLAAGNEDADSSEIEKSKADKVINKLRIGWGSEMTGACRDKQKDKLQNSAEADEALTQINSNSPELQDFSTEPVSNMYDV